MRFMLSKMPHIPEKSRLFRFLGQKSQTAPKDWAKGHIFQCSKTVEICVINVILPTCRGPKMTCKNRQGSCRRGKKDRAKGRMNVKSLIVLCPITQCSE